MSALIARVRRVPAAIEGQATRRGLAFAWWIPVLSIVCEVGVAVVALVQRHALWPPESVAAVLLLILLAHVVLFVAPGRIGWWIDTLIVLGATWWLLSDPVQAAGPADSAPALLMVLVAVVMARDGVITGLVVWAASVAMLFAAWHFEGLSSPVLFSLATLLGLTVGVMLRWQMRALTAERAARAGDYERATLAERQRIAREIHDLVAHSLSVTLLQVAGAREALRDGDVSDALDALDDAEGVARRAMADIRGTVSSLATSDGPPRPLPTAAQIPDLVTEFASAGLVVSYRGPTAELADLDGAAGLGLYRIAQEALANIAKHAPSATAALELEVGGNRTRMIVRNSLPGTRVRPGHSGGSGLAGMAARAAGLGATLTAGAAGEEWVVDVRLAPGSCPARRPSGSAGLAQRPSLGTASS
ncbi:MAG TPA: histidine kinase [Marmoricola sp.]